MIALVKNEYSELNSINNLKEKSWDHSICDRIETAMRIDFRNPDPIENVTDRDL